MQGALLWSGFDMRHVRLMVGVVMAVGMAAGRWWGRTGDATHISVKNKTAGAVTVYWIDTEGERRKYATVAPGESWDSSTYDGHVWVVTDAAEKTLGVYEATRQASSVVVEV